MDHRSPPFHEPAPFAAACQMVSKALCQYTPEEQLKILGASWLASASRARAEASRVPGGFSQARAEQVERLIAMIESVTTSEPDPEAPDTSSVTDVMDDDNLDDET